MTSTYAQQRKTEEQGYADTHLSTYNIACGYLLLILFSATGSESGSNCSGPTALRTVEKVQSSITTRRRRARPSEKGTLAA